MTRKKVELSYITDDKSRRCAYQKRKKGLLKKAKVLTTLCGVEACAVIHNAYESNPVVWPDEERARRMVEQLRRKPETNQKGKIYDYPTFLWRRINKSAKELTQLQKENRQKEVAEVLCGSLTGELRLEGLSGPHLSDLRSMIDMNLVEIDRKMKLLEEEPQPLQVLPPPEREVGIPGGDVGPMGQLLLGMEPSDAGSDM